MPRAAAYSASKAGLIALTKTLGKELAESGILVNAITPAISETAMAKDLTTERRQEILGRIPMRRFVLVEEIAAQVAWLCSDDCSFATGAVFDLSGGRATWSTGTHDPAQAARQRYTHRKRAFAEHAGRLGCNIAVGRCAITSRPPWTTFPHPSPNGKASQSSIASAIAIPAPIAAGMP